MNNPGPRLVDEAIEDPRNHLQFEQTLAELLEQARELSEQLEAARNLAESSIAYAVQAAHRGEVSILPRKFCKLAALAQVYALPKVLERLGELVVALGAA